MIGSPFVTSSGVALNNIRSLTGGFVSSWAELQSPISLKMCTFSSNKEMICSSFLRRSSGTKHRRINGRQETVIASGSLSRSLSASSSLLTHCLTSQTMEDNKEHSTYEGGHLTSDLLRSVLLLSPVLFCLTGNSLVLVFLPVNTGTSVMFKYHSSEFRVFSSIQTKVRTYLKKNSTFYSKTCCRCFSASRQLF